MYVERTWITLALNTKSPISPIVSVSINSTEIIVLIQDIYLKLTIQSRSEPNPERSVGSTIRERKLPPQKHH
jgi:hypothetical protein